jgi:hypothetical protein
LEDGDIANSTPELGSVATVERRVTTGPLSNGIHIQNPIDWVNWFDEASIEQVSDLTTTHAWFFDGIQEPLYSNTSTVLIPGGIGADNSNFNEHPIVSPNASAIRENSCVHYTQESSLESPTCGYPICTYLLSEQHRQRLLSVIDSEDAIASAEKDLLTLPSLRQGIHRFCRFLAKEYPILHGQVLVIPGDHRAVAEETYGQESPPELLWLVITFGWSMLDHKSHSVYRQIARKVQSMLRRIIISVWCLVSTIYLQSY